MTELERDLERDFFRRIRLAGGYAVKLVATERGVPDRLVLFPPGRMYLVELKTTTGKLHPLQVYWHEMVRERFGIHVVVLHGPLEVRDWIAAIVERNLRRPLPVL